MVFVKYRIGQKCVGQKIGRSKIFLGQNFRLCSEFLSSLSDFCKTFVLDKIFAVKKFPSDKIFVTNPKFRQFSPIRYLFIYLISESNDSNESNEYVQTVAADFLCFCGEMIKV